MNSEMNATGTKSPGPRPTALPSAVLRPLRDNKQAVELVAKAKADAHAVIAPTHVMLRGEEIIGYLSLGGMTTVQAWFDSKSGHARDSVKMIESADAIMADKGLKGYCVAVSEQSPFAANMERLGFESLGKTVLWYKKLI